MNRISLLFLCQIYVLLLLVAATIMSALPQSLPALALLLIMLLTTFRPQPPRLNMAIYVGVLFLTPLVLAPPLYRMTTLPSLAVQITTVVLVLPAIYLFDYNLRQNTAEIRPFMKKKTGRYVTYTFFLLLTMALTTMLLSLIINNPVLLFTGITFILYLLGVLIAILRAIPRQPFNATGKTARVIAGTAGSISLHISSRASATMYSYFQPSETWAKITPTEVIVNSEKTRLDLSYRPPLAGHSHPQIEIAAIDSRGFLQINQLLEPLQLQVIPRARYAEWLARKYMEHSGTGTMTAATIPTQATIIPERGTDYWESRTYQPGDQLKDIDWKHTLKLSQLIVKEYIDTAEQAAIIAVNLSVTDAEEADKLAFNLIMAALTLAQENIPTAFAVYNHRNVILSTAIIESSEIVRQALSLFREIAQVKLTDRHLEPTDIARIRRNINQLKKTESEPARRLLSVLDFEHRSIEELARSHPATIALSAVTRQVASPAMILLVSQLNHDTEAILVTTEKLARRSFTTIPIGVSFQPIPR
jgi:uncharacterized protein (DUF58 family)